MTPSERPTIPPWARISSVILFGWALVHAIRTRTVDDFIKYPGYIAGTIALVLAIIFLVDWVKSGRRGLAGEDFAIILGGAAGAAVGGIAYYSAGASIKDAYLWIQQPSVLQTATSKPGAVLITILGTVATGALLFYIRLRLRSVYGLTEAIVGVTMAANRVMSLQDMTSFRDSNFYLALLTAGIYLVVRGMDNIHQGLTKSPLDPAASAVVNWYKRRTVGEVAPAGEGVTVN